MYIRKYAHKFFPCLSPVFLLFKLVVPIREEIVVFWLRMGEVRLPPCKNDNAQGGLTSLCLMEVAHLAFDAIAVRAVCKEFSEKLTDAKVDKVYQPERDELAIVLRTKTEHVRVLLSASSANPRAHFTSHTKENPKSAPMFCMLLRKHLVAGKVLAVVQPGFERVLDFQIESYTELGDLTVKHLIIEIMGRHSNIILTEDDGRILDAIKHIDFTVSAVRQILPGMRYAGPPPQEKLNPLTVSETEIAAAVETSDAKTVDMLILNAFEGVSPLVAREISYNVFGCTDFKTADLTPALQMRLCNRIADVFSAVRAGKFSPCLLSDANKKPIEFCALPIKQYGSAALPEAFDSMSAVIDGYFYIRDSAERQKQKSATILKTITNNINRCAKKIVLLEKTVADAHNMDKYKLYGDLITANLYRIQNDDKTVTVQNYYEESMPELTITLDTALSPQKNAQKYYKKYNKAKTALTEANKQLSIAKEELSYLESVEQNCRMATNEADLNEIRAELAQYGYIVRAQKKKCKAEAQKMSAPMHFISSDGFDIYCGKNNVQNDYLTLRFANNADLWFHTKNFPGSHVIIKLGLDKDVPERTLREAAIIAATHSSAKHSAQVPVDYTQIKNVKKPSGAKAGMVIYDVYNTVYVMPDEALTEQLKGDK